MYRTAFTLCVTCIVFANAFCVSNAQENETPAKGVANSDAQTPWVTSLSQLGESSSCVASTGDGLLLREATVYKFEAANPSEMTPIYSHPAAVWQVVSSRDASKIASVDYRGNLGIYDTGNQPIASKGAPWNAGADAKLTIHEKAFERWCQALAITPDDKFLIAGNEAGKLFVWDIAAGKVSKTAELDGHAVTGVAISPESSQVAVSDGAGHVHLFSWPKMEPEGKIKFSDETVWCVAYAAPGTLLAGSSDRNLYQAEAKADSKAESAGKGSDWITQIAISPAGRVAVAEVGGKVHFPQATSEAGNATATKYTLGNDSMKATSGVWAVQWNAAPQGDEQVLVGTRKNGVLVAGRSWKWTEPAKKKTPEPEATVAEETKPKKEMKKEDPKETAAEPEPKKPEPKKPAPEKPAPEKPAPEKPAPEKPAPEKPADTGKKNE
jgi:WD40 repeat protein